MQIKIGEKTLEIKRMSNDIFRNAGDVSDSISVELRDTAMTAQELEAMVDSSFKGTITLVDGGTEESFEGYEFTNIRKNYDSAGKQLIIAFGKAAE